MVYYYNRDGKFQKESGREYKTEKGAVERMMKEGVGAVFDETGKLVHPYDGGSREAAAEPCGEPQEAETAAEPDGEPQETGQPQDSGGFQVRTTCDTLCIRAGAGKGYKTVGYIMEKAGEKLNHAITEETNGWGRLESGAGWIELAFAKRVG